MAEHEVGIRLSLKERRETAQGLAQVEGGLEQVGDAAEKSGQQAATGSRGFKMLVGGMRSAASFAGRGFVSTMRGAGRVVVGTGRLMVSAFKGAVVGATALSVAVAGLGVKAIGLASDAAETGSAFDTVFGPSARRVQKDLDGLSRRFGLYNPELQDASRQFGVFGKAAGIARKELPGFSTDLVKAGLDLSSFYNTDPGETFQALQSGLSGEAEPLRKFGIFISDATMKAKAASMGLKDELTEQQKVMVRQRLIMDSLGDAQGDLARTSDGFANQQRGATGRLKQMLTTLGGPLTVAATGAFRGLNSILKVGMRELNQQMPGLNKGARSLSGTFEAWGKRMAKGLPDALDRLPGLFERARSAGDRLAAMGDRVGRFFDDARRFTSGIDWGNTSAGVSAISDSISKADWSAVSDGLGSGVSDTVSVFGVAVGFAADHVDTLAKYLPLLVVAFAAYKVAQTASNVAKVAEIPLTAVQIASNVSLAAANRSLATQMAITNGVEQKSLVTKARSTVAMVAQKVATVAVTVATRTWAAGQWLLNAALSANPIGLVVAGIALLVAGVVLAYKKSETFRGIVDGLWNNVLKPFGSWMKGVLVGAIRLIATSLLNMGQFGIRAFRWLLTAAFKAFDGILAAAEKGMGWIPGIGGKIKGARRAFDEFGDATIGKLERLEGKLRAAERAANDLGRDRSATISIVTNFSSGGMTPRQADAVAAAGLPGRAKGGPVRRGVPYIVGELQPEVFVPDQNGRIVPRVPSLSATSGPVAPTMRDIDGWVEDDAAQITVGPSAPGGPITVQVVVDKKVLGEVLLDDFDDRAARR